MTAHLPAACQVKTPSSGQRASARRRKLRHKPEQRHTTLSSFAACRDSTAARSTTVIHAVLFSTGTNFWVQHARYPLESERAHKQTYWGARRPIATHRWQSRTQSQHLAEHYHDSKMLTQECSIIAPRGMTARIDTSYHYTKALRFLLLIHFSSSFRLHCYGLISVPV